jgi:hypothetical protein
MTAEWPNAPRLRRALEQTAAEAQTDTAARDHLGELLRDADGEATVPTPLLPEAAVRPRWAAMLAVAAITVVALGLGALLVSTVGNDAPEQVSSSATASTSPPATAPSSVPPSSVTPSTTTPPAPASIPRLAAGAHCGQSIGVAQPYLLEVATASGTLALEIGVSTVAAEQPEFVVVGADTWQATASQVHAESGLGRSISGLYYLPFTFDLDAAEEVASALLSSTCDASTYLLALAGGNAAADALACAQVPGRGFNGFAFVDPGAPPDGCSLSQPTVLVGSEPLAQRSEWERHQGCVGATTVEDDEGNLITTYTSCDSTLIHVDTRSSDPLAATIDGVPAVEFLIAVTGIAK